MKRGQAVLSYFKTFLFLFFGVLLSLGMAVSMNKTLAQEVCKQIGAFAVSNIVQLPLLQKPRNSEDADGDGVCTWVTCQSSGERKCAKVFERPCTNLSAISGISSRRRKMEGRDDPVTERLMCHEDEDPFTRCYIVVDGQLPWEDATEACYDKNLDLVSVESEEEWQVLIKYLRQEPGIYWTSGNCQGTEEWTWDSQCVPFNPDFAKWSPVTSGNVDHTRPCVSMNITADETSSAWDPRPCDGTYKVVCKLQSLACLNQLATTTIAPDTDSYRKRPHKKRTQSGITKLKQKRATRATRATKDLDKGCYKISDLLHPPLSWDEARLACISAGLGDLTTIGSDAELDLLITAVKDQRDGSGNTNLTFPIVETFWIGGLWRGRLSGLFWRPTCDAVTYTKWQWEPDEADTADGLTCTLFAWTCDGYSGKKAMGMRMGNCNEKRRHICKQKTKQCRV